MTKSTDGLISSSPPSFMQNVKVAEEKVVKAQERELTEQERDEYERREATIAKAATRLTEMSEYLTRIGNALDSNLFDFVAKHRMGTVLDAFINLETQANLVDAQFKVIQDQIKKVREVSFPARLDAEETRTATSSETGSRVSRTNKVYASIKSDPTGDTLERAYEWLREPIFFQPLSDEDKKRMEDEGLTIRDVGVPMHPYTRNSEGEIVLIEGYNDEKPSYASLIKETVNASSLSSLAKEVMETGRELPDDLFNIYTKDSVSITKGKKKPNG